MSRPQQHISEILSRSSQRLLKRIMLKHLRRAAKTRPGLDAQQETHYMFDMLHHHAKRNQRNLTSHSRRHETTCRKGQLELCCCSSFLSLSLLTLLAAWASAVYNIQWFKFRQPLKPNGSSTGNNSIIKHEQQCFSFCHCHFESNYGPIKTRDKKVNRVRRAAMFKTYAYKQCLFWTSSLQYCVHWRELRAALPAEALQKARLDELCRRHEAQG